MWRAASDWHLLKTSNRSKIAAHFSVAGCCKLTEQESRTWFSESDLSSTWPHITSKMSFFPSRKALAVFKSTTSGTQELIPASLEHHKYYKQLLLDACAHRKTTLSWNLWGKGQTQKWDSSLKTELVMSKATKKSTCFRRTCSRYKWEKQEVHPVKFFVVSSSKITK